MTMNVLYTESCKLIVGTLAWSLLPLSFLVQGLGLDRKQLKA